MTNRNVLGVATIGFLLIFAGEVMAQTTFENDCASLAAAQGNDTQRLRQLFKLEWVHRMQDSPEFATEVGYPGQNDRWTDQSLEAIERRKKELHAPMKVI